MPDLHGPYLDKCLCVAMEDIGGENAPEKSKRIRELLIDGASPNSVDENNRHIICEPSLRGNVEVLLLLVGFGTNVNFFLKPEGDSTAIGPSNAADAVAALGRQIWNRGGQVRLGEDMGSNSSVDQIDREESAVYGSRMSTDRQAPLQMCVQSGNTAAVAILARHTNLLIMEEEEEDNNRLAAMRLLTRGPVLDPLAPILKASLLIRYEVLAAAVMQGCQSVALRIITDGKRKQESTGVEFDVMRIFYGYEAAGVPIIPMFRMPLLPAELAEKYGNDIEGRNLIHLAVENGQVEMLEALINTNLFPLPYALEAPTEPNPAPQIEMPMLAAGAGHTPLHLAALKGNIDVVTSLVDAGVNVNITNRLGQTILDVALKYDQEDVVNFIRALDLYDAAKQGDIGVFDHLDLRKREHMTILKRPHRRETFRFLIKL
ncbi:cortactin-binding protein, putative [Perkinsus marinus ATCC 50983]|uniref:Cortactin-binding protein, putative n=1 Tax=Perkinsus marinus (strain ATCC 50983 / TXsc) TaxID=423536 RepID=C5KWZ4_PERM5|nr:cortactin-binding protein, putative [Perkinsus marinus ATCC 50983]EER10998.1 cortactin-binding protein, putative [Perkinsus marinus ATCC 50983]|eukprot:XP_002779203.1 cortactin-binding protein, putative [Perkinsus marinus ATCC 50983]